MPVTYVSTNEDQPMATCHDTYDLLTTASRINRAGRELIPLLRALPKPMLRTCTPLATDLAALAERRALVAPGLGVPSKIDALITGCDQCCRAKSGSAGVMSQAGALRDRLVLLQELVAWLHDQLEARRSFLLRRAARTVKPPSIAESITPPWADQVPRTGAQGAGPTIFQARPEEVWINLGRSCRPAQEIATC